MVPSDDFAVSRVAEFVANRQKTVRGWQGVARCGTIGSVSIPSKHPGRGHFRETGLFPSMFSLQKYHKKFHTLFWGIHEVWWLDSTRDSRDLIDLMSATVGGTDPHDST